MKMRALPIILLWILPCSLKAQDLKAIQQRASVSAWDARFEIIQLGPDAKWACRLDRVTGNVDRIVANKPGNLSWQKMRVLPHPKAVNSAKPHFQIFVSHSAADVTLLLDTESGAAWQLVVNGDMGIWQPIE